MVVSGQHDDNEEDHYHPAKGLKEAPGSEEEIPGDDDAPGGLATTNTNAQTQEATANNADEESGDVVHNVARNAKRNESTLLLLLKQADNHHNHQPSRVSLLGHQQAENATTTNDKNKNNDNINTKVSSVATEEVDENTVADIDADSSSSPMMMPPPPPTTTTAPQTAIATVHNKEAQAKRVHDDCIQHNDTTTACGACTNPKVPPAAAAESMLLGNRGLPGSCGPANTSTTTSGGAGAGADALGPPALSSDLTQQPPKLGLVLHSLIQAVPAEYTKIKEDPNHYQSSDSSRVQVDGSSTKNQTRIAELATCMMMITGMDHDAAVLAQPPTIVPDDVAAAVEVVGADEDDDKENTESHNSGCGLSPNGDHDDDKDDDHDSSRKYQSETTSRGRNEEEAATVKEKSVPLASQQQGQTSLTIAPVDESYKEVLKSTSNMEDEENNGGISSMECPKKHLSSSTSNAQSSQQATKTKADQPMAFNSVATDMPTEQSQGKMLLVANPDDSPVLLPMKTFEDSEVETTAEYSNETKIILTDKNGMLLFSAESQSSDFSKRENNGEEVGEETKNEENPLTSTNGGRDEIMTLPIPGKQGSLLAAAVPDDADPHTAFQTSQQNCDKVPAASSTTEFLPTRTAQEQKAIYQSEGTKAQEPISDEALVALKEEENTHSDKTDDHLANSSDLKNSAIPANDACRTGTLAPEIELQPCTNPVPSASESYLLIKKKEKEGFVGCCNAAVPYKNNYLQSMPVLADVVVDVDDSVNTRCSEGDSILAHDNADIKDGEVDDPASDWDEFWCMPAPELFDALSTEFFDDMMKDGPKEVVEMIRSFQNNNSRISSSGGDDRTTTATKFVASQHTQKANHNTQSPTRSIQQPQQETTMTKTKEKQVMLAKVNGTAEKNASAIGTTAGHDNDGVIRDLNQVVANDTDEDSDKFVLASVAAPSSEDEDEDDDHELLTDCILPDLIPDSILLARVDCTELYETGETLQKLLLLAHSPCRTPCCDNDDDDDDDHHPYEAAAAAARQNQRILQTQQVSCSFGAALETFKERNHRFIQERAKKRRERKRLIQRWRKTQKKADVVVTIHSDDEDSFYSLESF
ncbi:hypothetical protein ACA910_020368 [Epithemia clementina (nom. ined.)]